MCWIDIWNEYISANKITVKSKPITKAQLQIEAKAKKKFGHCFRELHRKLFDNCHEMVAEDSVNFFSMRELADKIYAFELDLRKREFYKDNPDAVIR